jgi:hypothetical protein
MPDKSFQLKYCSIYTKQTKKQQTPWPESASELYRTSDSRFSAKLVPTFADRGRYVVSLTDPYGCILDFLDLYSDTKDVPFAGSVMAESLLLGKVDLFLTSHETPVLDGNCSG